MRGVGGGGGQCVRTFLLGMSFLIHPWGYINDARMAIHCPTTLRFPWALWTSLRQDLLGSV